MPREYNCCVPGCTNSHNCTGAAFLLVPPNDPKCLCVADSDPTITTTTSTTTSTTTPTTSTTTATTTTSMTTTITTTSTTTTATTTTTTATPTTTTSTATTTCNVVRQVVSQNDACNQWKTSVMMLHRDRSYFTSIPHLHKGRHGANAFLVPHNRLSQCRHAQTDGPRRVALQFDHLVSTGGQQNSNNRSDDNEEAGDTITTSVLWDQSSQVWLLSKSWSETKGRRGSRTGTVIMKMGESLLNPV